MSVRLHLPFCRRSTIFLPSSTVTCRICRWNCRPIPGVGAKKMHRPSDNQTWLAGKYTMKGGFMRKITYKWSVFRCHVWLPEGISKRNLFLLCTVSSPCNCRLARNDFHNDAGLLWTSCIQFKGSQSKRLLLSFDSRINKKTWFKGKVLVHRKCCLWFYPKGQLKVCIHGRSLWSFTAHGPKNPKFHIEAPNQPRLGAGRLAS